MATRSDIDLGLFDVATTDTPVIQVPVSVERIGVTAAVVHNTTGGDLTLTLWESSDLTSGAGDEVAVYDVPAGESTDILELIGQGYDGKNIIAQGSGVGLNFRASCTTYTEGD